MNVKTLILLLISLSSNLWALTATPVSSSQINLSWVDNLSTESGYAIERSLIQTSGFSEIARVPKNTIKFSNANLAASTRYYYRVRGYKVKNGITTFFTYSNTADALTLAAPEPMPTTVNRIYGVTITNPWNQMPAILKSLSSLAKKPTARVVFDEFVPASEYKPIVDQIHPVSYVMGEILDSYYVPQYSTQAYINRTVEYLNTLGSSVDIWEVGNEVNGEWLGDTATVTAKISGAYDAVKAAGKTTALTLYFNQGCYSRADHEMFTWATANVPDRMKTGLDYVFISFYEDDCNGIQPDWNVVFQKLGTLFPNSKIGFGENGTTNSALKETYINRYYKMTVNHPRFVSGNFWWYFDAGDMVPQTNYLWQVLNNAIIAASSTSSVLFSDNFSNYTMNTCLADGSTFGQWQSTFAGYGCNSIISLPEGPALSLKPMVSTTAAETHAGLVVGPSFTGDINFETMVKTQKQLRTGTTPNPWEVAWVVWNYTDNTHFYYFIAKPNGWELGKEDPAYPGAQRFLAAGSSSTYPIGQWLNVKIIQKGNVITVSVNGSTLTTFTDNERPYSTGRIGFYSEDSEVYLKSVKVSRP